MIHFFDLSFSWADLELKCQNFRLLFSMYLVNIKDALHQAVSFIYRFPHPNVLSRTKSVFSTAMFFQSCAILLLKKGQKIKSYLTLTYIIYVVQLQKQSFIHSEKSYGSLLGPTKKIDTILILTEFEFAKFIVIREFQDPVTFRGFVFFCKLHLLAALKNFNGKCRGSNAYNQLYFP